MSRRTEAVMGTIVTIDVPPHVASGEHAEYVSRAFDWFRDVERVCTRFDPDSELMRLVEHSGTAVAVSPTLFELIRFALAVAEASDGAFDPTVGLRMERLGFNREYGSGRVMTTGLHADSDVTFRDVRIDDMHRTVALSRPMVLDLGAVAKGMAIDLAARELAPLQHFAIDAGGDLYLAGRNADGAPWSAGIRHPDSDGLLGVVHVSDRAVCTSGNYERRSVSDPDARHIIDPRTGQSPTDLVSATVVAPSAMLADALATTALVLGPVDGRRLLDEHGVCGVFFTSTFERLVTEGCSSDVVVID
ncbi:MAG: FAD:protein FMN transferase [Acidobacteria bacterium]|nr:FAD:protein FMN transferase [Acidobacteriota bacterium]